MIRRTVLLFVLLAVMVALLPVTGAGAKPPGDCATITQGEIFYRAGHFLEGQVIPTGYDAYGYNYQAHRFQGWYPNVYLGGDGFPPYEGDPVAYEAANPTVLTKWYWYPTTRLSMPWNEAWISNKDCDGDGALDRHPGFASYIGSGAWETNHMWDSYLMDGQVCRWVYFTKIVAVPADAYKTGGVWYTADGVEIGPDIWGSFATIQSVYNDPCGGFGGIEYLSPNNAGFGSY